MNIIFKNLETDIVYSTYHPTFGKVRFLKQGTYDVAKELGEHLIRVRPELFGETEEQILKVRGINPVRKVVPKKKAKKDMPTGALEPIK